MTALLWIVTLAFGFVGWFCLRESIRSVLLRRQRAPFLRQVEGTVLRVHSERKTESHQVNGSNRMRTVVKFHPVIQFRHEKGHAMQFRSEMGESYPLRKKWNGETVEPQSTYFTGQTLPVCYDIEDAIRPCIDTWGGRHGLALGLLVGGLIFCGVSVLIGVVYGARLIGLR